MAFDFNVGAGSRAFDVGIESRIHARSRGRLCGLYFQGTPPFVTGQIGEGIQFTTGQQWALMAEADSDWARKSFTLRLWFRFAHTQMTFETFTMAFHFGTAVYILSHDVLFTGIHLPQIKWTVNGTTIEVTDTGGGEAGPGTFLSDDTWHRAVAWYDHDTLEIGLQIDSETPVTGTTTQIASGRTPGFVLGADGPTPDPKDIRYDEVALWNGIVLTEDERDTDWNDGAGTGWPDVKLIQEPMAYWSLESTDLEDNTETFEDNGLPFSPITYPKVMPNLAD